jgi:hypothetical protein
MKKDNDSTSAPVSHSQNTGAVRGFFSFLADLFGGGDDY